MIRAHKLCKYGKLSIDLSISLGKYVLSWFSNLCGKWQQMVIMVLGYHGYFRVCLMTHRKYKYLSCSYDTLYIPSILLHIILGVGSPLF